MNLDISVWASHEQLRPSWSRHIEFLISSIGSAVGLGNVWRFPHLTYTNGGGAFLIPYTISLFLMGIPLLCLEFMFGQFASLGPVAVWEINPMFKGLGYSLTFVSMYISIFYNVVIALGTYFLFASINQVLPWTTCGNKWNTCACRTRDMNLTLSDTGMQYIKNGLNCNSTKLLEKDLESASEEYFNHKVWQKTEGMAYIGAIKWDLTLCNLLVWVTVCASIIKGVKSIGKVNYFLAVCPFVLLSALVIRGLTLPGAGEGVNYYLTPDATYVLDPTVWTTAASQIMFSLGTSIGTTIAFASYNTFHSNFMIYSLIISLVNCLTSFYAGFAVFTVLGYMAKKSNKNIHNVTTTGPGLVFVVYPEALATMPFPHVWSILFFSMFIFIGLSSQYALVETILTSIQDEFPNLRKTYANVILRVGLCAALFLLGLPNTTQGGSYILTLNEWFLDFPLLYLGLLEFLVIVWIYGIDRLTEDVFLMVGRSKQNYRFYTFYYKWTMKFGGPLFLICIIIFQIVGYRPFESDEFAPWAKSLGWTETIFIMMWVPLWYIYKYLKGSGGDFMSWNTCKRLNQPTFKWGPMNPEHRILPRYREFLIHFVQSDGLTVEEIPTHQWNPVDSSTSEATEGTAATDSLVRESEAGSSPDERPRRATCTEMDEVRSEADTPRDKEK